MELEPLKRLTRDIKKASTTLSTGEVRFLVDYYYALQEDRIRSAHQVRTLAEAGEPHQVIGWIGENTAILERNIKSALDAYTDGHPVGRWSKSIVGIGPIIAAGLLAHIDIQKAPTVGHIWRFAGLDPTVVWEKKTKRPWNAALKTLCWKIGESFVKFSGHEDDVYGKLYLQRKAQEQLSNDAGAFAGQAAAKLERFRIDKDTDAFKAYSAGKLPPAHVHARAKRWAVKLFLAHWHEVAYRVHFNAAPPKPYVLEYLGHAHPIVVPNWPMA
jgi:Transposase IS116/IS110/IS902 family